MGSEPPPVTEGQVEEALELDRASAQAPVPILGCFNAENAQAVAIFIPQVEATVDKGREIAAAYLDGTHLPAEHGLHPFAAKSKIDLE
jgi:hypothetical protein